MSARGLRSGLVAGALGLGLATAATRAHAGDDDGLYGRFEGDLDLRGGAGIGFASGGASLSLDARALYLSTAGLYFHYTDALGGDGPLLRRSLGAGVVMAPFFLARYAKDMEHGPARLDLFIDSISLQFGTFWSAPRGGDLRARPGLEVGLGVGVPLFPRASGLFLDLSGGLRFVDEDLASYGRPPGSLERIPFLSVILGWHQVVRTHLVDVGDRVPR